uniref:protein-ribulosamine 3-kinase n=1 Tax=Caligus rogercresseyi TaxID=217165 RepID=C1BML4_CALRO|nr:Ketosamine-3-kinase [Caligus rogercresseyi]
MESFLKESLGLEFVRRQRSTIGGYISQGNVYESSAGTLFVKKYGKAQGSVMFKGEFESLKAIESTETVRVPRPMKVLEDSDNSYIVMEYLDMKSMYSAQYAEFGTQLAKLHLHNIELETKDPSKYVSKFGFRCETCCGVLPQNNSWDSDWVSYFTSKLEEQMERIRVEYDDEEAENLWTMCNGNIQHLFSGLNVKPSLLHGDLWSGNVGQLQDDGSPVTYDPAAFYGHHEYDLGIAGMLGGFSGSFYEAYHSLIPKAPGFEKRSQAYQLFHYLNHWNHFGNGYRPQSMAFLKKLSRV